MTSMQPIIVINPNSNDGVTDGLREAVAEAYGPRSEEVQCETLSNGPAAIESAADIAAVVPHLVDWGRGLEGRARAVIVACFGDPGVEELRAVMTVPVLGICEASLGVARNLSQSIGVISILDRSVPRHLAYYERLGYAGEVAGDRAVGLGVAQLADRTVAWRRLREVGERLRDEDGAQVLILGCAGMARYRRCLEDALGIRVLDPTLAALSRLLDT